MRKSALLALALVALWAGNSSIFEDTSQNQTRIIAHRGVHQIYAGPDRTNDTCRASPILPLTHRFIENTLPSMEAAFAYGADVVEIDVHLTPEDGFAVFHDWTLECLTNGSGVTHQQDMATLKALDVGYRYSVDGKNYPLRGNGVGMLPTLDEVLNAERTGKILINFKSNRAQEGAALATLLKDAPWQNVVYGVYGGAPPTRAAKDALPGFRAFDKAGLASCLGGYALTGWTGWVPPACRTGLIAVPINVGPWLWGWPHRFTRRMKTAGTEVILWGPYDGTGFSSGIDDEETLISAPSGFDGYIWTNRIEIIGPLIGSKTGG